MTTTHQFSTNSRRQALKLLGVAGLNSVGAAAIVTRQVFAQPAPKDTIINTIYHGLPKSTESCLPPQSFYYNPDLPVHEYSLDKARSLLDGAGWQPAADGIRVKNGMRLPFSNSTTSGNHLREQVQQYMQQNFRVIGIDMTIRNLPPAVMWGEYWSRDLPMLPIFQHAVIRGHKSGLAGFQSNIKNRIETWNVRHWI